MSQITVTVFTPCWVFICYSFPSLNLIREISSSQVADLRMLGDSLWNSVSFATSLRLRKS